MKSRGVEATEWVRAHIWQIGTALAVLYTGYLTGQMKAEARYEALAAEVARNEASDIARHAAIDARFAGRFEFMADAAPVINYLCSRDPECRQFYPQVEMPQ